MQRTSNAAPKSSITTLLVQILVMLLPFVVGATGDSVSKQGQYYQNISSHSSPWLRKVRNHHHHHHHHPQPPDPGCSRAPWICRHEGMRNHHHPPRRPRMQCCRNHCVDVSSDMNNCGMCGIRCPFNCLCCGGLCVNTNVSPFNCGRCFNRCSWRVQCAYGMCGYAGGGGGQPHPWPHLPFPHPPHPLEPWPRPPFHFPPRQPHPPCPPEQSSPGGRVKLQVPTG